MAIALRHKFSTTQALILGLLLVSGGSLFIFTRWFLSEVKEPSDKISAITLALTTVTATGGAINYLLKENKEKTKTSEKAGVETLMGRVVLIRKATEEALTDDEIIALMPPQLKEDTQGYLKQVRDFEDYLDVCQSVANYLSENERSLQIIAKAGVDDILEQLNPTHRERLFLSNEGLREVFYEDIYLYLKVWLILSIEYLQPMPVSRIQQSIDDRNLYIKTLNHIRENIQWFHLPNKEAEEVVKQYFETLISKLTRFQD